MSPADASFWAGLARKRIGAGALVTDPEGRVLMVEPTYKEHWEIPGGAAEAGETAVECCRRECQEEIGMPIEVGRLLVLDHQIHGGDRGDSIMFVYDGGVLSDPSAIRLPADELRSYRFVEQSRLRGITTERLSRRVKFAVDALTRGICHELDNGVPR